MYQQLNQSENVLIVATSARMLAQAASRIGYKPIVIDVFSDIDTQFFAHDICQIPSLSKEHLIPTIGDFVRRYSLTHCLYGSGFEYYPESLQYLTECFVVIGNQFDCFYNTTRKKNFFSTLDALHIFHPEVSFIQPEFADDWLIKPMLGHGGGGIKRFRQATNVSESFYWQKFQAGTQHSVLFLANGQQAQVVGFNTQWTSNLDENAEFIFSGVINSCDLNDKEKENIIGWLTKLVPALGLLGLNSLDFIYADGRSYVLEINPRPSASMQLYDDGLLRRHIQACQGGLMTNVPVQARITGYQVIYAEHDLNISKQFCWPEGVVDIPRTGILIRKGQPICSIIANEKNPQLVFAKLAVRQKQLIKNLEGTNQHGILS